MASVFEAALEKVLSDPTCWSMSTTGFVVNRGILEPTANKRQLLFRDGLFLALFMVFLESAPLAISPFFLLLLITDDLSCLVDLPFVRNIITSGGLDCQLLDLLA